ncbi:hypothetical protein [Brevundimonas sp.]|uniref:hypothetical protein n=1 Tax=Brevundimonas sp. TaxID=1871086 RepID=UPI001A2A6E71|nr:hypothetical protein [Brevundimonas sp.]MBJ7484610.1 hypothetical protein [Brevundimonas sp.]
MTTRLITAAALLAALSLTGCDRLTAAWTAFQQPAAPTAATPSPPTVVPAVAGTPPTIAPLTPTSRGLPVKALPDETLQYSAGVVELYSLDKQQGVGAKIFGTAGGDPAMNGLQTYIAFYRSPADGWWVYGLGDFLDFKVLNEVPGQVDLEIEESTMDAEGTIGSRKRRAIIVFPVGPIHETQPVNVRMMPAD